MEALVSQKLYVGNLPFKTSEEEVKQHFSNYGNVVSVSLITDRETGRARGFGFVEMEDISKAVAEANNSEFGGRKLVVNQARERERTPRKY
jgi:RNA recognition motif-containing protein